MQAAAWNIRPIEAGDDAAMARIIRTVMPEFGACGQGFAINDPEVDWMSRAYAQPRSAYFVLERDGAVVGGGGMAPLEGGDADTCELLDRLCETREFVARVLEHYGRLVADRNARRTR